ncbi:unnamed protein product [Malus baccata var. baccata]
MSQLITHRRSVTNAPPTLSASTAPAVSAPLIGEPTPNVEATSTTSQVPVSSTSLVSVELLSARRPHRRCHDPEPSDQTSSASRVEGEASQPPGQGDEDLCREGARTCARTCTSHTDVRLPNLTTSTSSCSTFDLKATLPCRYPVA